MPSIVILVQLISCLPISLLPVQSVPIAPKFVALLIPSVHSLSSIIHIIGKYGDFGRCVNDFFSKDFPTGLVKVETITSAKNLLGTRPMVAFTDEFKVSAARDMTTGLISTEVKSTTFFPILKTKMGMAFYSLFYSKYFFHDNRGQGRNHHDL